MLVLSYIFVSFIFCISRGISNNTFLLEDSHLVQTVVCYTDMITNSYLHPFSFPISDKVRNADLPAVYLASYLLKVYRKMLRLGLLTSLLSYLFVLM